MVGWIGRLVGIQIASIVGTIATVLAADWVLPFSPVTNAMVGMLLSGCVFFWAAYTWIDWDTTSGSLELTTGSSRLGD
jgi:hypothetical protein